MDPLITNADAMRAAPTLPHQRDDFLFYTYPNILIPCQLYHTPGAAGPAPDIPVAPRGRGRPSAARLVMETQYAADLANFQAAMAAASEPAKEEAEVEERGPPARPEPSLIFTHGRGSSLDNPALVAFSQGFARASPILCFHDTRPMTERVGTFRALMNNFPTATAVGGRSMGARASCRACIYSPVHKVIFFTYPLKRDLDERFDEVLMLPADVDVLFILGDSDPMAPELILKAVRARMRARTWWIRLVGADHAVWYASDEIRNTICNVAGQIAEAWNADENRDPTLTELTIQYNAANTNQQVEWTNWMAPAPEPVRDPTQFHVNILGGGMPFGGGNITFSLI